MGDGPELKGDYRAARPTMDLFEGDFQCFLTLSLNFNGCIRFLDYIHIGSPALNHGDFFGGEAVEAEAFSATDGEGDYVVGVFDDKITAFLAYLLAIK